jgi:RNA polymerase sigma factor (sigma-70 family)
MTDAALVTAARAGDRDAFATIVSRYQRAVLAVAYAITCDRVLADDLAQEAFVVAWRELDRLQDPARLSAWLCGITRKRALHTLRWRRREVPLDGEAPAPTTPFDQLADHERDQLVAAALARVPETYRDALVLYYGDDRSADAVARALGITVAAANQRLSRGRAQLAADLATVETQLARRPRRDLVAGVLAAIAGLKVLAGTAEAAGGSSAGAANRASMLGGKTAATGARVGASTLLLVAAAATVLAGGGYLASSVSSAAADDQPVASTPEAAPANEPPPVAMPDVANAAAKPSLDPEPAKPTDDAPTDDDPALTCEALGEHWASLIAAFEPDDAYHALRAPEWVHQEAFMVKDRCAKWSVEGRRCVAAATSAYDLMWKCGELGTEPSLRLSFGKHVEPETGDDLSCAHVSRHVASLYELDPERFATVPAAYKDAVRQAYVDLRRDVPADMLRDCEREAWSETRRRCNLLARADYLNNCAPY